MISRRSIVKLIGTLPFSYFLPKLKDQNTLEIREPKVFDYEDISKICTIHKINDSMLYNAAKTPPESMVLTHGAAGDVYLANTNTLPINRNVDGRYYYLKTLEVLVPIQTIVNAIDCRLEKHTSRGDKQMRDIFHAGMELKIANDIFEVLKAGSDTVVDITSFKEIKEQYSFISPHNTNTIIGINPDKAKIYLILNNDTQIVFDVHLHKRKRAGYYGWAEYGIVNANPVTVYNYLPGLTYNKSKVDQMVDNFDPQRANEPYIARKSYMS